MAKFLAQKHFGSLRPVDDTGEDALRKIGQGQVVTVEVKQSRNIKHHRMFFALMTLVWNQMDQEKYPTVEDFVEVVKIAAGHRKRIVTPRGEVGFIPRSIAFHKMDQTAFDAFYDRVCDLLAKHFLPGVTNAELKREVSLMIGAAPDRAEAA